MRFSLRTQWRSIIFLFIIIINMLKCTIQWFLNKSLLKYCSFHKSSVSNRNSQMINVLWQRKWLVRASLSVVRSIKCIHDCGEATVCWAICFSWAKCSNIFWRQKKRNYIAITCIFEMFMSTWREQYVVELSVCVCV